MKKKNLAIITTHPIQYQTPLFKKLSSSKISVDVFFASKQNLSSKKKDLEFNVNFNWDVELLKGYNYFLRLTGIRPYILTSKCYHLLMLRNYLSFSTEK